MYIDKNGNMFRNLFVATGISVDHKQLPGFNTMKIDESTMKPKELKETIMDITKAYGQAQAPSLEDMPTHVVDFGRDYGFEDMSAETLFYRIQQFENDDFKNLLNYLSDKLGFDSKDEEMYEKGLKLAASWSLINKSRTQADAFFCQSIRGRTESKL